MYYGNNNAYLICDISKKNIGLSFTECMISGSSSSYAVPLTNDNCICRFIFLTVLFVLPVLVIVFEVVNFIWMVIPDLYTFVNFIAEFVEYAKKITRQQSASEYRLLSSCLFLFSNATTNDLLDTFSLIDDHIYSYDMYLGWHHQVIKRKFIYIISSLARILRHWSTITSTTKCCATRKKILFVQTSRNDMNE